MLSYEFRQVVFGLSAQYIGSQLLDPSRDQTLKSGNYFNTNLRIGYETRISDYPMTVFIEGRNLLDTAGSVAASPVYSTSEVPLERRRIGIGLEARF